MNNFNSFKAKMAKEITGFRLSGMNTFSMLVNCISLSLSPFDITWERYFFFIICNPKCTNDRAIAVDYIRLHTCTCSSGQRVDVDK